jgi:hypothetical protein
MAEWLFLATLGEDKSCEFVDVLLRGSSPDPFHLKDPIDQTFFLYGRQSLAHYREILMWLRAFEPVLPR